MRARFILRKKYYFSKAKKWGLKTKEWFIEYKKTLKCEKCGESHPSCLDFHHKKDSSEEDTVCMMVQRGYSKKSIIREIKKCIILCSNCHRMIHRKWNKPLEIEYLQNEIILQKQNLSK